MAVYEDFSRNIPGFIPPSEGEVPYLTPRYLTSMPTTSGAIPPVVAAGAPQNPPGSGEDLLSIYEKLVTEMDSYLQGLALSHSPASPQLVRTKIDLNTCMIWTSFFLPCKICLMKKTFSHLL